MWGNRARTVSHHCVRRSTRQSLVTLEVTPYTNNSSNVGRKIPTGGERGHWLKIVIGRRDEGAAFAPAREGAHFDGGFGVHRDPQDVVRRIGGLIDLVHLDEDG